MAGALSRHHAECVIGSVWGIKLVDGSPLVSYGVGYTRADDDDASDRAYYIPPASAQTSCGKALELRLHSTW